MVTPTSNCVISRPDPRQLWDRISGRFSATVLGGAEIIPESNEWYVTALNYAMAEEFYAYADQMYKESDPRTACCDNLVSMASDWGMYPLPPSFAEGYVQITGSAQARLVPPLEMEAGGKTFQSIGNVPARLNRQGVTTVRFRALEAGPDSNLQGVTEGRLTNPTAGITPTVGIYGGQFCGGASEEPCEAFRQRFLARMSYQPRANNAWLVSKLKEWPCVTRVCDRGGVCCNLSDEDENCPCSACRENNGNDFYVMFDNTFECGVAPSCVLDEIEEWLFGPPGMQGRGLGQAPINVCGKLHPVKAAKFDIQIDASSCLTTTQMEAVEDAIRDFMTTVCPSTELSLQTFTVVIGQVLGMGENFSLDFLNWGEGLEASNCGIVPECDVLPCLNEIFFVSPSLEGTSCI